MSAVGLQTWRSSRKMAGPPDRLVAMRPGRLRRLTFASLAIAGLATACGDDRTVRGPNADPPSSSTTSTAAIPTTPVPATVASSTTAAPTTALPATTTPQPPEGRDTFRLPMNGAVRVTLAWNCRGCVAELGDRHHPAIDYISSTDHTIVAAGDGIVVRRHDGCGPSSRGCGASMGNYLFVAHRLGDGSVIYTFYAHLAEIDPMIVEGACVAQGTRLGTMGNSGIASAPHLHFAFQTHTDVLQYTRTSSTEHGSRNPDDFYGKVRVERVTPGHSDTGAPERCVER
jgi:murein DD-endopeptidase MepM/ murein hydrolase activator NlpD